MPTCRSGSGRGGWPVLAAGVLLLAFQDAQQGDSEAIEWLSDPEGDGLRFWSALAERDPDGIAERAREMLACGVA